VRRHKLAVGFVSFVQFIHHVWSELAPCSWENLRRIFSEYFSCYLQVARPFHAAFTLFNHILYSHALRVQSCHHNIHTVATVNLLQQLQPGLV
jgi:hypothetical protein